jgi:molybdopterin-containing oxidoreductase family membrane subunit
VYTFLFWVGQVLIGTIIPVFLFWSPRFQTRASIITGSLLIILGGFSMIYVVVVGGQAYPMDLITGMQVSSSFADGEIAQYVPSLPEFLLGMGGVAFAIMATLFVVKILPFIPQSLADNSAD